MDVTNSEHAERVVCLIVSADSFLSLFLLFFFCDVGMQAVNPSSAFN